MEDVHKSQGIVSHRQSVGDECRNFAMSQERRHEGLHLQTPRGDTCRLPGMARADSGGCKTGRKKSNPICSTILKK